MQVGEQPLAGAIGRPAQSQVAVQVGEQVIGLPAQSQVAVQVGEHLAGAMGLPEQSQVAVQVGEQRPATVGVGVGAGVGVRDFCVEVGAAAGAEPASPPSTSCWKFFRTSGSDAG